MNKRPELANNRSTPHDNVLAYVWHQGRVLLTPRKHTDQEVILELPGCRMSNDPQQDTQSLIQVVKEKTGLDIKIIRILSQHLRKNLQEFRVYGAEVISPTPIPQNLIWLDPRALKPIRFRQDPLPIFGGRYRLAAIPGKIIVQLDRQQAVQQGILPLGELKTLTL